MRKVGWLVLYETVDCQDMCWCMKDSVVLLRVLLRRPSADEALSWGNFKVSLSNQRLAVVIIWEWYNWHYFKYRKDFQNVSELQGFNQSKIEDKERFLQLFWFRFIKSVSLSGCLNSLPSFVESLSQGIFSLPGFHWQMKGLNSERISESG